MTGGRPCCGCKRCKSSGPSGGKTAVAGDGRLSRRLGGRTGAAFDRCCFSRTSGPIRWLQLDGVSRANARTEKIPQGHKNFFMTLSFSHFASFVFRVGGWGKEWGFSYPHSHGGTKSPPSYPPDSGHTGAQRLQPWRRGGQECPPSGGPCSKEWGFSYPH